MGTTTSLASTERVLAAEAASGVVVAVDAGVCAVRVAANARDKTKGCRGRMNG